VKKLELKLIVENVPVLILCLLDYNYLDRTTITLLISEF